MCGRKTLTKEKREIIEKYDIEESNWEGAGRYRPNYNIAPTNISPILIYNREKVIKPMHWGLIPSWSKDISIGQKMINARSETLQDRRTFRPLLKKHRCIVIADGYYEWRGQKGNKQPYYIRKPDHGFMSMAGLWSHWESRQGKAIDSYTVITTAPSQNIIHIHNRMPAILKQDDIKIWLDQNYSVDDAQQLLGPYNGLEFYPVSKYVNSVQNNSPKCIQKRPQLF
ncbi:MAG: SOS response-associated peptidase [Candidatus Marinimicrobia bacterium]|nr:SOS response-associated peptidase [Candidatus Neomarinimicrobiota bacterium]